MNYTKLLTLNILSNSFDGSQYVIDELLDTKWSCNRNITGTCWIALDMGSIYEVDRLDVAWYRGEDRVNNFDIYIDNNTLVYSGISSGNTTRFESYHWNSINTTLINLTITNTSYPNTFIGVTEMAISRYKIIGDNVSSIPQAMVESITTQDVFGTKLFKLPLLNGPLWNSSHWNNGIQRILKSGDKDRYDPTKLSENRGSNADIVLSGNGEMEFKGYNTRPEPRLHLNRPDVYKFVNVECTLYYMRVIDDNTSWGGMTIGARSGTDGHSLDSMACDAHTYYGRLRHDGKADLEKELKHPSSSTRDSKMIYSNGLPFNKWLGFKFIIYNKQNSIVLQTYRDETNGINGGNWIMMSNYTDNGGWSPPESNGQCDYPPDFIPLLGGGVIVLRDTGTVKTRYKKMTVIEIMP